MRLRFLPKMVDAKIKESLIVRLLALFLAFAINCFGNCCAEPIAVGTPYGGGTVFCVAQASENGCDVTKCVTGGSGDCGLIMANEDQVNFDSNGQHGVTWSSASSKTIAVSEGDGAANTADIIKDFPASDGNNGSNNAAWLCHDYKAPGGDADNCRGLERYTNWYLPSKNELNKMYLFAKDGKRNLIVKGCTSAKAGGVQCLVGGYNEDMCYWSSSSQYLDYYSAWYQCFRNGVQGVGAKNSNYFGVRAVRAFGNLTPRPSVSLSRLWSFEVVRVALKSWFQAQAQATPSTQTVPVAHQVVVAVGDQEAKDQARPAPVAPPASQHASDSCFASYDVLKRLVHLFRASDFAYAPYKGKLSRLIFEEPTGELPTFEAPIGQLPMTPMPAYEELIGELPTVPNSGTDADTLSDTTRNDITDGDILAATVLHPNVDGATSAADSLQAAQHPDTKLFFETPAGPIVRAAKSFD